MQQENVSSVLLIRLSKGKVKGDWRNYGLWEAGQSDSELGRGEIDGYGISGYGTTGGNRKADAPPKSGMSKASIFSSPQRFLITRETSWLWGTQ